MFCDKNCFLTNWAQLLTLEMAKLGPIIDFTAIIYIYIYIYIYMGGRPQLVGTFWSKNQKFPNFKVKLAKKKRQKGGDFHVSKFLPSFFLSVFFCLSVSSLPLLFDILKPIICPPPDEVFGKKKIYIYICIYMCVCACCM